jgi:arylformamidase
MKFIDISVPLHEGLPIWPKSPGFSLLQDQIIGAESITNNTHIVCDIHAGTHIDAPRHFIADGDTVENLSLEVLIGSALVIDIPYAEYITADHLEAAKIPPTTERLLIKTENSRLWDTAGSAFHKDFVGLKPDAASWIVDHGIRLVGIDYLSVQPYHDSSQTHSILLRAGVIIIEGLNLTDARRGIYTLICLPLRIKGAEGAPARAVLLPILAKDFS